MVRVSLECAPWLYARGVPASREANVLHLLTRWCCPRRALHWGNVAPGRNLPLTRSWRP